MEDKGLLRIENWFKKLNGRFDEVKGEFQDLSRKMDNRHKALLLVCTNIRRDLDNLRRHLSPKLDRYDKYDARLTTLEIAIRDIERRVSQ